MENKEILDSFIGRTLKEIKGGERDNKLIFIFQDGSEYLMHHVSDCCEGLDLEDICGNLENLCGSPILQAEETSLNDNPKYFVEYGSHTWTFYKFATIKGYVTLRWYGESIGYSSESVDIEKIKDADPISTN